MWLSPARPGLRVGDMGKTAASGSQPPPRRAAPPGERQICPVLVGRDDMMALADRRLVTAARGSGQLLLLAGEAGIGKTRLLTQIIARAIDLGFSVHSAGAYPRDHELAGGLLADLAADLTRSPETSAIGAGLARRLGDIGRTTHPLPPADPADGDAHWLRRILITDLADAICSLGAAAGPVMITLEDLHWADDSTLAVLERIGRQLPSLTMVVVCTFRSDELYPRLPLRDWRTRLLTQRLAEEVRLTRLSPQDTAVMSAAISGIVLPEDVTDGLYARSDGIPLHVEEFLATIAGSSTAAEVPDTLADAVLTRAQRLSPPARALADAASVIGRSFDVDLLTSIADRDPTTVDDGLRELTDRFFVQPQPDRSGYDFRHALIRDALYADLTPHRRRQLHARTAEAAVAAGFGDAFVSDQYERANHPSGAHDRAIAAAAGAVAISAHREAVELYQRALRTLPAATTAARRASLLGRLATELAAIDDNDGAQDTFALAHQLLRGIGDDIGAAGLVPAMAAIAHLRGAGLDERVRLLREGLSLVDRGSAEAASAAPAERTRKQLHAALSAAYMLDRRLDESIADGQIARQLGNSAVGTAGDSDETECNLAVTLGSVLVFAGRSDEGWQMLEDAVAVGRRSRWEAEAARAYRMISTSASVLVEYDRAERWLADGIDYAERTERFNDRHYMSAHLAHVHWATGDWQAAEAQARHALADGRSGITTKITALIVLGYLGFGRDEPAVATAHLAQAADLGGQMRELQRVSPAWWGLAETALHADRPDEAIDWCERGLVASSAVRDAAYLFPFVLTGTRAQLASDNLTGARDWVSRSTELVLQRGIPGTVGVVPHAEGLLLLHEGRTGRAHELLSGAVDFWHRRRRFWEGTQAMLDLARCAARSRRPAEAASLAGTAAGLAAAAGATLLSIAAAAQLGATAREPGDTEPPLLTARESEVARLVAGGATNREIAAALTIAPKTVAAHIEHILAKLGATRRTQIASWVVTRQSPVAGTPGAHHGPGRLR